MLCNAKQDITSLVNFRESSKIHTFKMLYYPCVNAYRVLLTRARQGLITFVPEGDIQDPTRDPEFYDGTYEYLIKCGFDVL